MAEITAKRRGEVVRGVFQVLLDHPAGLPPQDAIARTKQLVPPTPFEESEYPNRPGVVRYDKQLRFHTITAVKSGWLEKTGKVWRLTEAGRDAFRRFADPIEFEKEAARGYGAWAESRALDGNRAWLVRGSNVSGLDLVQRLWLVEGLVSLPATRLRRAIQPSGALPSKLTLDEVRRMVDEDYAGIETSYNAREQLAEDIHAFVSLMMPDDDIVTLSGGELRIGAIVGDVEQIQSSNGLSNLRRAVEWSAESFDYTELPDALQQLLSVQREVVNLTKVGSIVRGLGVSDQELAEEQETDPSVEIVIAARENKLDLPEPDDALADELRLHDVAWLREVRELLLDQRQIVFYGPPGTGKTYLAQKLAAYFTGNDAQRVTLVQFHPSYSYEDFFEGFRPREDKETGNVAFRITAGPLRELADLALREGNAHIPHFLIIDELNRANLAKVFGELYFLLEYRRETVKLTYSRDDFRLPPNLFIIGTMNTADRSIALVDAAMRRRFAFVELSPAVEPTKGLLHRWLARASQDPEPALLLDALNARIEDPDFKIGPSYLMKPGVFREGGLDRTWRTKILPLLEEHHYGEDVDVQRRYGLGTLRRMIKAQLPGAASVESPLERSLVEAADGASADASGPAADHVTDH